MASPEAASLHFKRSERLPDSSMLALHSSPPPHSSPQSREAASPPYALPLHHAVRAPPLYPIKLDPSSSLPLSTAQSPLSPVFTSLKEQERSPSLFAPRRRWNRAGAHPSAARALLLVSNSFLSVSLSLRTPLPRRNLTLAPPVSRGSRGGRRRVADRGAAAFFSSTKPTSERRQPYRADL